MSNKNIRIVRRFPIFSNVSIAMPEVPQQHGNININTDDYNDNNNNYITGHTNKGFVRDMDTNPNLDQISTPTIVIHDDDINSGDKGKVGGFPTQPQRNNRFRMEDVAVLKLSLLEKKKRFREKPPLRRRNTVSASDFLSDQPSKYQPSARASFSAVTLSPLLDEWMDMPITTSMDKNDSVPVDTVDAATSPMEQHKTIQVLS